MTTEAELVKQAREILAQHCEEGGDHQSAALLRSDRPIPDAYTRAEVAQFVFALRSEAVSKEESPHA